MKANTKIKHKLKQRGFAIGQLNEIDSLWANKIKALLRKHESECKRSGLKTTAEMNDLYRRKYKKKVEDLEKRWERASMKAWEKYYKK